jgi:arylsulfatase A-like enzyme
MSKHNNILIVMADQLTAKALGCYGNQEVKRSMDNS